MPSFKGVEKGVHSKRKSENCPFQGQNVTIKMALKSLAKKESRAPQELLGVLQGGAPP